MRLKRNQINVTQQYDYENNTTTFVGEVTFKKKIIIDNTTLNNRDIDFLELMDNIDYSLQYHLDRIIYGENR